MAPRKTAAKKAATVTNKELETQHRDWKGMLTPIFLTVGIAMLGQILTGIWQAASFKSEVSNIAIHQKLQDDAITQNNDALRKLIDRLPQDYMTRQEILDNRERSKEQRETEDKRLDKMDTKIDTIIANQNRNRRD